MITLLPARMDRHQAARHVHAARTRGGIVILDAARDMYQGLYLPDSSDAGGFAEAIAEAFPGMDVQQRTVEALPVSSDTSEPAWQDCEPDWSARLRVRDVALFLVMLLFCSARFHGLPFIRLVGPPFRSAQAAPIARYRAALARFQKMSALLPFPMQCLFRSHLLLYVLRGYGLGADWVFGVSLFPFQAHCWLAVDRLTLIDRAEKTEDFVPIMIVRRVTGTPA